MYRPVLIACLTALAACSCATPAGGAGTDGGQDTGLAGDARARDLPLLPGEDLALGWIVGFSPLTSDNVAAVEQASADLFALDVRTGRFQVDWAGLEPQPGEFDASLLREHLEALQQNHLAIFMTLETIDSEGFVIPADLLEDQFTLANGMAFDDPMILQRLRALLDWLVPIAVDAGVYLISVGNEPDNTIADDPSLATPTANFVRAARDHAHSIDPRLAIGMTLTTGILEPDATYAAPIVAASDVLVFNYHCGFLDGSVRSTATVRTELEQIKRMAGERSLVIQELGCSAGEEGSESSLMNTEAVQAQFVTSTLEAIRDLRVFRAAYWFTLIDWSPEVAALSAQPLCEEGAIKLCELYAELLRTTGLLRWEDGSRRPAWDAFVNGIHKQ